MVLGVALNFSPIDPIRALYWSAVLNGVVAVPLMVTMMFMTMRRTVMARFTLPTVLQIMGWLATATMATTVVAMIWSNRDQSDEHGAGLQQPAPRRRGWCLASSKGTQSRGGKFFSVSGGEMMARQQSERQWSAKVTKNSNALDLEREIFKSHSAKRIAASLKRSAEHSHRRKGGPFQSAMTMLNFYVNRAGKNLPESQSRVLEAAKTELRRLFDRTAVD
jgi:hypothetical protein